MSWKDVKKKVDDEEADKRRQKLAKEAEERRNKRELKSKVNFWMPHIKSFSKGVLKKVHGIFCRVEFQTLIFNTEATVQVKTNKHWLKMNFRLTLSSDDLETSFGNVSSPNELGNLFDKYFEMHYRMRKSAPPPILHTGCFPPEALILGQNGAIRINDLSVGEAVFCVPYEGIEPVIGSIVEVHSTGLAQLMQITHFTDGGVLKCAFSQHLLTDIGWEMVGDLKPGQNVGGLVVSKVDEIPWNNEVFDPEVEPHNNFIALTSTGKQVVARGWAPEHFVARYQAKFERFGEGT